MTKGKKWTLRLLGVAALALLICLCLLGSTMARYTSEGVGGGTLTVALWDLETSTTGLDVDKLSPSNEEYSDSRARTHETGESVAVLTMMNNSAVSAYVEFDLGEGLTLTEKDGFTWGTGFGSGYNEEANAYGQKIMEGFDSTGTAGDGEARFRAVLEQYGVITIDLNDGEGNTITDGYGVTIDAESSLTIYGDIIWTSIYENDEAATEGDYGNYDFTSWGEFSDAVDTILGMYYEKINFTVNWTAVQASVIPSR